MSWKTFVAHMLNIIVLLALFGSLVLYILGSAITVSDTCPSYPYTFIRPDNAAAILGLFGLILILMLAGAGILFFGFYAPDDAFAVAVWDDIATNASVTGGDGDEG